MFTLAPACHFLATPAKNGPLPAPTPVRVREAFIDAHHLPAEYDEAAMRFVRARDVQAGDLIVGIVQSAFLATGDVIPIAVPYPFTADPARLQERPCNCRPCSSHAGQTVEHRGGIAPVHLGHFTVPGPAGPRRHCEIAYGSQWLCVLPAQWVPASEGPEAEFATLTVVVRRDGTEGDPCETVLAEHPDVVFIGCENGVTDVALGLGAEQGSRL